MEDMNKNNDQVRTLQDLVKKLHKQEELLTEARENSNYLLEFNKYIYMELAKQRNDAKSKILRDLLDKEILSMQQLSDKFVERWKVLIEIKNEYLDSAMKVYDLCQENAKEHDNEAVSVIWVKNLEISMARIGMIKAKMELDYVEYVYAVHRDFKDWKKLATMLIDQIADLASEFIPVISKCKSICEKVVQVAEIINEMENKGTDYREMDLQISKIECHIDIMEALKLKYEFEIDDLKQNLCLTRDCAIIK